jgi:hypothetical protein
MRPMLSAVDLASSILPSRCEHSGRQIVLPSRRWSVATFLDQDAGIVERNDTARMGGPVSSYYAVKWAPSINILMEIHNVYRWKYVRRQTRAALSLDEFSSSRVARFHSGFSETVYITMM